MDKLANQIIDTADYVLAGGRITYDQAAVLLAATGSNVILLLALANKIREKFVGDKMDLCAVISAKAGRCSEDCAFCAQSVHSEAQFKGHGLLSIDQIVAQAVEHERNGAQRCDIATCGLGYTGHEDEFKAILAAFSAIKEKTNLKLCACLGTLTPKAAQLLASCGVERYNINLETAPSYFPRVVTSHDYTLRLDTIKWAQAAGMEVCSGMIIGLGETPQQRLEHAFLLRELDVDAVPINILMPVPGTWLKGAKPLPEMEILKTFAIMRFILPQKNIRFAAGREINLGPLQPLGLIGGLNGMLIGNYLTKTGQGIDEDMAMLRGLGYSVESPSQTVLPPGPGNGKV